MTTLKNVVSDAIYGLGEKELERALKNREFLIAVVMKELRDYFARILD